MEAVIVSGVEAQTKRLAQRSKPRGGRPKKALGIYGEIGAEVLVVTQKRSSLGEKPKTRATLRALGLRGVGKSRKHRLTSELAGMLKKVSHLVDVQPVLGELEFLAPRLIPAKPGQHMKTVEYELEGNIRGAVHYALDTLPYRIEKRPAGVFVAWLARSDKPRRAILKEVYASAELGARIFAVKPGRLIDEPWREGTPAWLSESVRRVELVRVDLAEHSIVWQVFPYHNNGELSVLVGAGGWKGVHALLEGTANPEVVKPLGDAATSYDE